MLRVVFNMMQGYDTWLGERAMNLSGGQKQRLAIARSIISEPTVLLLDEATSALDPKAEKIVQQALDRVSKDRTTIVIAHKLSTIRNADNIAVIADGAVVEQGTHEELIGLDGAYGKLPKVIETTWSSWLTVTARLVKAQDLGQTQSEEVVDEDKAAERIALVRTQTQASGLAQDASRSTKDGINYNLVNCVFIVLKEQGNLWKYFVLLGIATIVGGIKIAPTIHSPSLTLY
jgi:ATP-binding cassette subfamily B (MDR/TAP) protein 1